MAEKNKELNQITDIFEYFKRLSNLELKNYFILIAVKDTPGNAITNKLQQSFADLGLKENLISKHQCGYIAVISDGILSYEYLSGKAISIKCNIEIDGYNLDVNSLPYTVGNTASIVIGSAQCAVNSRGLNIVVFNKNEQNIIDSVCFDTHIPNYTIKRKDCSSIVKTLFRNKTNMVLSAQTEQNTITAVSDLKKYMEEIEVHNDVRYWQLFRKETETEIDAKKRFFYGIESFDPDVKLIQDCISVMFYHFDRICRENEIPYWMVGGSLIGAVRHGKCVPWDDDIDVYMERNDVKRLQKVLENNKDFVVNVYYGMVGQAYICYIRFMFRSNNIPCFIDIFFTDRVKDSSDKTWDKLIELRQELVGKTSALEMRLARDQKLVRNIEIEKLLNEQVKKQQDILNPSGKGTALLWSVDQWQFWCKNVFDYDWIFPTRTVPFAYGTCEIPAKTEKILELWYGDIYTLPKNMLSHRHVALNKKQKADIEEAAKKYMPKGKE